MNYVLQDLNEQALARQKSQLREGKVSREKGK